METDHIGNPLTYWNKPLVLTTALKYKTKMDFYHNALGAYSYARTHGFLAEACRHMVTPKFKHTKKAPLTHAKVFAIAKKYKRRVDFQKNENRAWCYSVKHNIKDQVCKHMMSRAESLAIASNYWTLDEVIKIAKKCKKWTVFSKKHKNLIRIVTMRGWKSEILKHLIYDGKNKYKDYSDQQIINIVKKYKTYEQFKEKEFPLYSYLNRNKLTPKFLYPNLKYKKNHKIQWTKEIIIKKSLKYNTLQEFQKKERVAYNHACKFKMIDTPELSHLIKRASVIKWNNETITKEAKKYTYRRQFKDNSESAYNAARRLNILDKVCEHMEWRGALEITKEMVLNEAKKYNRRTDFSQNAEPFYRRACQGKYLDEACAHMMSPSESFKFGNTKWTPEALAKEALKYKSRSEFGQKSSGAYDAALNLKIMDKICSHMIPKESKWTYEKCKKEVKKYKSLKEFSLKEEGCLKKIYEEKWIKLIKPLKSRNPNFYERLLLHPKIKEVLNDNYIIFQYEPKIVQSTIPDFILEQNNKLIIVEAKTENRVDHICKATNHQIIKQIDLFKKHFKDKKIIHILLSENGYIFSKYTDYCLSLSQFDMFLKCLKNGTTFKYKKLKPKSVYKQLKESALAIEQEYLRKIKTKY